MNTQKTVSPLTVEQRQKRTTSWQIREHVRNLKYSEQYFFLHIIIDLLLLNGSILASIAYQAPLKELAGQHTWMFYSFLFTVNGLAIAVVAWSNSYRVYDSPRINIHPTSLWGTFILYFGVLSMIYYQFFYPYFELNFLFTAFCSFLICSSLIHWGLHATARRYTDYLTYAVIGGDAKQIKQLEAAFGESFGKKTVCIGRFANDRISDQNHLGSLTDIKTFLQEGQGFNQLLYLDGNLSANELEEIDRHCRGRYIEFGVVPQSMQYFDKGIQVACSADLPIVQPKKAPVYLLRNKMLKRAFDIVVSLAVILLIFPWLLPIVAILIKLESRGPVFFTQERSGCWNQTFKCLKFRSMVVNKESNRKQAEKKDSRITRVGAFLRKTSLDELPQFLNVFMGHMSVVGPRPHMLIHTDEYSQLIDTFMIRHSVKPGITGWAQVNGWRGATPEVYHMAKRVEYDLHYIEHWSLWLDIKCVFLTVYNVFKGEKNAF